LSLQYKLYVGFLLHKDDWTVNNFRRSQSVWTSPFTINRS